MVVPTGSGTETFILIGFMMGIGADFNFWRTTLCIYTRIKYDYLLQTLNASTDFCYVNFKGKDGHAGSSGSLGRILRVNILVGETFVWNDKFSFNGYESTGTNVLSASEQIALHAVEV